MRLCFSAISIQTHKCKNSLLNSLIKFRAVIAFFYLYSLLISIQQTSNRQSVLQLFLYFYFYFYLMFITEAKKHGKNGAKSVVLTIGSKLLLNFRFIRWDTALWYLHVHIECTRWLFRRWNTCKHEYVAFHQ